MEQVTLSSKGQIAIPKAVREALNLSEGAKLTVEVPGHALYAFYNFCRVHKSLRVTPAMEAKITDHVWDVRELLEF
jgi:AbrB family looped-hinge helix DNA binding protein